MVALTALLETTFLSKVCSLSGEQSSASLQPFYFVRMFSDIKSTPDYLIQRVKYSKAKQEETAEWEEKKVHIYNYINDVMDDSHLGGGKQIENQPAANKVSARFTALSRMLLYILVLAGIISLTIYFTLEIIKLKNNHSHISGKWCPDGWTRFGCSCYFKSEEKKTWYDSRTYCQGKGADLVIINSKAEQEFIKQFNKDGKSWIGLQGEWISEKRIYDWKWVDESPLTQTFWGTGWTKYDQYQQYGVCCDTEGKWKHEYNYKYNYNNRIIYNYKHWICEK